MSLHTQSLKPFQMPTFPSGQSSHYQLTIHIYLCRHFAMDVLGQRYACHNLSSSAALLRDIILKLGFYPISWFLSLPHMISEIQKSLSWHGHLQMLLASTSVSHPEGRGLGKDNCLETQDWLLSRTKSMDTSPLQGQ